MEKAHFSGPAHAAALDGTSYPVWQPRSTPIWLAQMNKISLSGSRQGPFKLSQPSPCAHKSTPGGHIYKKHERLCMCVVVDFAPICIWKGTFALAHTRPGALAYQHKLPWQGAASFACCYQQAGAFNHPRKIDETWAARNWSGAHECGKIASAERLLWELQPHQATNDSRRIVNVHKRAKNDLAAPKNLIPPTELSQFAGSRKPEILLKTCLFQVFINMDKFLR